MTRIIHRASLINQRGGVSALCFKAPRSINLKSATWTNRDVAVTCPKCRAKLDALQAQGKTLMNILEIAVRIERGEKLEFHRRHVMEIMREVTRRNLSCRFAVFVDGEKATLTVCEGSPDALLTVQNAIAVVTEMYAESVAEDDTAQRHGVLEPGVRSLTTAKLADALQRLLAAQDAPQSHEEAKTADDWYEFCIQQAKVAGD